MEQVAILWQEIREYFPLLMGLASNVGTAITIFLIGLVFSGWMRRRVLGARLGTVAVVDDTLRPVIASTIYYTIIAITIYAALRRLGIEATGLLAVFGAAGLAIGLALKDTLGNIASGFMLLILRPLNVGDYVQTPTVRGTILEVGLFSTTVKSVEGIFIYVPNSEIWSTRIQNFGRHTERKLIVDIGVSYDTDIEQARAVLIEAMRSQPMTRESPEEPHVLTQAFTDSAIILSSRVWMPGADWLVNASTMRQVLKEALDKAGIEIPFPQRVVLMRNNAPD